MALQAESVLVGHEASRLQAGQAVAVNGHTVAAVCAHCHACFVHALYWLSTKHLRYTISEAFAMHHCRTVKVAQQLHMQPYHNPSSRLWGL